MILKIYVNVFQIACEGVVGGHSVKKRRFAVKK